MVSRGFCSICSCNFFLVLFVALPTYTRAESTFDLYGMKGFDFHHEAAVALSLNLSEVERPDIQVSSYKLDSQPGHISIKLPHTEEDQLPLSFSTEGFNPQHHTLMFVVAGAKGEIADSSSLLFLNDENTVVTATQGAQCIFSDRYFCGFEQGRHAMVLQVSNLSENWLRTVSLRIGSESVSVCDLQTISWQHGFGLFLFEGNGTEPLDLGADCLDSLKGQKEEAGRENDLILIRDQRELGIEIEGTSSDGSETSRQFLALIHRPRQAPPPPDPDDKKESSQSTASRDSSRPVSDSSTGSNLPEITVTHTDKDDEGDEDKDPWKRKLNVATEDWNSLDALMQEQGEINAQLSAINEQLLALMENTEMDSEEKEEKRKELVSERERLIKRQEEIQSTLQLRMTEAREREMGLLEIQITLNRQFQAFYQTYNAADEAARINGLFRRPVAVSRQSSGGSQPGTLSSGTSHNSLASRNSDSQLPRVSRQTSASRLEVLQGQSIEQVSGLLELLDLFDSSPSQRMDDQRSPMPTTDSPPSGLSTQSSTGSQSSQGSRNTRVKPKNGSGRASILDGSVFQRPSNGEGIPPETVDKTVFLPILKPAMVEDRQHEQATA